MVQEMPDGYPAFPEHPEMGQVTGNPLVQIETTIPDQHQDGNRRGQWFGQRSEIKDGVDGHRRIRDLQTARSYSLFVESFAIPAHPQNRSGKSV